jgi:hypothetical protein
MTKTYQVVTTCIITVECDNEQQAAEQIEQILSRVPEEVSVGSTDEVEEIEQ